MSKVPNEITNYIARIKAQNKKEYAENYLKYRIGVLKEHPGYTCSTMAAQGVRMQIDSILSAYCIEV